MQISSTEDLPKTDTEADLDLSEIRKVLNPFAQTNNLRGIVRLITNWIILLVCSSSYFFLPEHLGLFWKALLYFCAICIVGARMRGFDSFLHDATHYTLFRTRSWNTNLQFLFAWPIFSGVESYQKQHLNHHNKFGSEDDPTVIYYRNAGIYDLSTAKYWKLLIRPLLGWSTYWYLSDSWSYCISNRRLAISLTIFWSTILVVITLMGFFKWFALYYLVPLFTIFPILMHFSEVNDHAGLQDRDQIGNTRNNVGFFLHKFFIHPYNDGYHLVHHLNPIIPSHKLKAAHKALIQIPAVNSRIVNANSFIESIYQILSTRPTRPATKEIESNQKKDI